MKFLAQQLADVKSNFLFQEIPAPLPDAQTETSDILAESAELRADLEAQVISAVLRTLDGDDSEAVSALRTLLENQPDLMSEDEAFIAEFNRLWAELPDEIKTQIQTQLEPHNPPGLAAALPGLIRNEVIMLPYVEGETPGEIVMLASETAPDDAAPAEAEAATVSPERKAELSAVLDAYMTEVREAFTAAGVAIPSELETAFNAIKDRLGEPEVAEVVALAEALRPNINWMNSQSDVLAAMMENPNFVNSLLTGQFVEVDTLLTGLELALDRAATPEERARIITEQLAVLPVPAPTAAEVAITNADVRVLINGVPQSMQSMFASEFAAWQAAMLEPNSTLISFNDYLIQQANGDEGALRTIQLKMQLSSIIEMIRPFLEALQSLTGQAAPVQDEADTERTAADQLLADQIEARERNITVEQLHFERRVTEVQTFLTENPNILIDEFYDMSATPPTLNEADLTSFLQANEGFNAQSLTTLTTDIRARYTEADATSLLRRGLSLAMLNNLADIPQSVEVTLERETGLKIGESIIPFEPEDTFASRLNEVLTQVQAEQAVEAAPPAPEVLAAFTQNIEDQILTGARAGNWDEASTFVGKQDSNNGFFRSPSGVIFVDYHNGGFDSGAADFRLDLENSPFAEDQERLLTFLRDTFGGKTLADIQHN